MLNGATLPLTKSLEDLLATRWGFTAFTLSGTWQNEIAENPTLAEKSFFRKEKTDFSAKLSFRCTIPDSPLSKVWQNCLNFKA